MSLREIEAGMSEIDRLPADDQRLAPVLALIGLIEIVEHIFGFDAVSLREEEDRHVDDAAQGAIIVRRRHEAWPNSCFARRSNSPRASSTLMRRPLLGILPASQ